MDSHPLITHLIYDLDGLLLNTEPIHAQVNQAIAANYGKRYDPSIQSKVLGRQAQDSAQIIIDLLALPLTVDAFLRQKDGMIYDLYPTATPMPGAMELTQHFYRQGIPQAIASSTTQRPFQSKIAHHQQWMAIFETMVLGDDPALQRGKPAPDCYLLAAERLGASPAQCLVFEDSIAGVTAAKLAGMAVIAVPAAHMDQALFQEADLILPSLTAFQPERWGLPAFA